MKKIFIAGHKGMVGSALVRRLCHESELILRSREEFDLLDQRAVHQFYQNERPDIVIIAAARVGGILANHEHKGEFLYENLTIQNHLIHGAAKHGTQRLCFLGSSCIYPKEAPQPIQEEALLTSPLEPTNEGYALAKICGVKLIEYYKQQGMLDGFSLMPCNLYGTNDTYDLYRAHAFAALVRRFVEADSDVVTLWGTGKPCREWMHVDDVAEAVAYFLEREVPHPWINIGWGKDLSIEELASAIAQETGYRGRIEWDATKPDGTMKKCMDVSRMHKLGFSPKIDLERGITRTIAEYRELV